MKNIHPLLPALLCALLVVSCGEKKKTVPVEEVAVTEQEDTQYQPTLAIGSEAPDFQVSDTLGLPVRLIDYRGKYAVLEFWASWCGDCRRETPNVQALWRDYHPKGVEFVGISFDHDADAWRQYLSQNPFPYAQGSNLIKWKENPINEIYGLHWIPTFFLIDPEGKVVAISLTANDLVPSLDAVVKE